jgi:glycosyltransferase involved in cell wall biosynthesis
VLIPADTHSQPTGAQRTNGGGAHVALFLSRLHPKKGVHDLIDAWARLRPMGWELWIAGPDEGGYRARLEAMVDNLSLRESCRFLGPVSESDKWQVYRQADVFVLPTYSENFGVTVAEALACAVPVITTTAAPWQVLIEKRCGWWIEPGLDALVGALREATEISDRDRRESGDRGKRYAIENLSWDRVAESTRACYEWLLRRADRPACVVD